MWRGKRAPNDEPRHLWTISEGGAVGVEMMREGRSSTFVDAGRPSILVEGGDAALAPAAPDRGKLFLKTKLIFKLKKKANFSFLYFF